MHTQKNEDFVSYVHVDSIQSIFEISLSEQGDHAGNTDWYRARRLKEDTRFS